MLLELHSPHRRLLAFGAAIAIIGILTGVWLLTSTTTTEQADSRLTIATTIFPLADIAHNVAGNDVRVLQLVPAGASPHSYTLTPQQLADLQNAQALFIVGHDLDDWAAGAVTRVVDIPVITVDTNIQLRQFAEDHEHENEEKAEVEEEQSNKASSIDPHYWLTVPNAQEIAKIITSTLQSIDPPASSTYANNLAVYLTELSGLEQELQNQARTARQPEFIAIHDAWSYFADHYGLDLIATYEPVEGREPSIQDIQELQDLVQEHSIDTFFTEPQKQSTGATRFLKDDLGLSIKVLDPIGGLDNRNSYANMMRENMDALTN